GSRIENFRLNGRRGTAFLFQSSITNLQSEVTKKRRGSRSKRVPRFLSFPRSLSRPKCAPRMSEGRMTSARDRVEYSGVSCWLGIDFDQKPLRGCRGWVLGVAFGAD